MRDPGDVVTTKLWRCGQLVGEGFPLTDVPERMADPDALVWVDLCGPDHPELRRLTDALALDSHGVEEAPGGHDRPKATIHASHSSLTLFGTKLRDDAEPGVGRAVRSSKELSVLVLPKGLVTVRGQAGFAMAVVERRWEEDLDLFRYGVGAMVHNLLDAVVDSHFDRIQQLDQMIEGLEDILFDERPSARQVETSTYRIRKELVELRRVILPMREVVATVLRHRSERGHNASELDGYFTDLYDHVLRASEWTESLRDMITTVFETNLTLQDARLNIVMKRLTGWAAIIAIPTAVTGCFGMNVPYPGFGRASGVVASTATVIGLGLLPYALFKRKDWL